MPSVNMPSRRGGAIERLAQGLGIANSILGIKSSIDSSNTAKAKQEQDAKFDDANSDESKQAFESLKGFDPNVQQGLSANAYERRYGKSADLYAKKFSEDIKSKSPDYALSQKDVAGLVKDGARLVPPGTKGVQTFAAIGADGKVSKVGLVPPPEKEVKGAESNAGNRLAQAPAETKSKVGLMAHALGSMTLFEKAYSVGQRPERFDANTPILGTLKSDTDLTQQGRMLDEAVGRLQSGGVIGPDELKTFQAMRPRPADTPEIQANKIAQMRGFLEDRLIGFGFKPQELGEAGYDLKKLGYDNASLSLRQRLGSGTIPQQSETIPNAFAGGAKFDQMDVKARQEVNKALKANPKDPIALEADKILRTKGI
jgi:hypothetical protein